MAKKGLKVEREASKEAKERIIRFKAEGMSNSATADEINLKEGTDISGEDVRAFFDRRSSQAVKVMKEDKSLQEKIAKQYFDTIAQMKQLNSEMWEFFYGIKRDPEYTQKVVTCPHCNKKFSIQLKSFLVFLKTADHLLNQMKHVDAVLGKLQTKQLNITYNYTDLSKKLAIAIPKIAEKLERQGVIKIIKKKKLREYEEEK